MKPDLKNISNSQITNAIDEWIHSERDRRVLKARLIDGLTYAQISDRLYKEDKTILSERQIQNIIYRTEDILFKHFN